MKHILIVGGGVIGLSVAYFSLLKGHRVTLLERGGPAHDACSLGNAGMVVPSDFEPLAAPGAIAYGLRSMLNPESPFYIRPRLSSDLAAWGVRFMRACTAEHAERSAPLLRDLQLASRALFIALAEECGNEFGLAQRGLLMLCKRPETLEKKRHLAAEAARLGIPAEMLTPDEVAKLDPGARYDIAGAAYFPMDCHLIPQRFVARMTREVEQRGARIVWEAEVSGWERDGGGVAGARTSQGRFEADEFVVCTGAWSGAVARGLGLNLPMQAGKGYSMTLPAPRRLPGICALGSDHRIAITPMGGALRVGGTMEITGLDESVNPRRVQGIVKSMVQYYPDFREEDFAGVPVWRGLRPVSPDGLPYVGRTRLPRLSVAAGHAMLGLSMGPITGKLMSEVLSDERPSIDIALLDPGRHQ